MRPTARIEEEIGALAEEVRELARQRGAGVPEVEILVDFVLVAFGSEGGRAVAEALDTRGFGAVGEAVGALPLAPAAEHLRAGVVAVFQAIGAEDYPAYRRESQGLREALASLLEARAARWRHLWAARDLYSLAPVRPADLGEQVRAAVAKLTRWEVLAWAGRALACAVEEVWRWRLWQTGWREYREEARRRSPAGMTEEAWQREIAEHTLPEAEAQVVDGWPVPPDAEWPEGNERALLPRLRKWQAEQGAREAALDSLAEGSSAP